MTIASAQGLTVDRAFLLVDERPARETIYPAATRHREGLDIYVNRSPLAFDIAEHRPEDQADMPVTDSDVRAYLAERWSRSQPKEAALDYVTDGEWRDASEGARTGVGTGASQTGAGRREARRCRRRADGSIRARAAANDNFRERIAREIRHAVNGWRFGAAVDAFAAERTEVLAAWDELREADARRGRRGGAEPGLPRDPRPPRRADEAGKNVPCQAAGVRAPAGRARRNRRARDRGARGQSIHVPAGICGPSRPGRHTQHGRTHRTRSRGSSRPSRPKLPRSPPSSLPNRSLRPGPQKQKRLRPGPDRDALPDWRTLYQELKRDWNDLVARSEDARAGEPNLPLLLMDGYDALIRRVRTLADHPDLSEHARNVLGELLEYHDEETVARETAEGYLAAAERHVEAYRALERQAGERGLPVARLDGWPEWREAAEMLAATGKSVLANDERYGAYLDAMTIGKVPRAAHGRAAPQPAPREPHPYAAKPEVRQPRRESDAQAGARLRPYSRRPREAQRATREGGAARAQARQAPAQEPRTQDVAKPKCCALRSTAESRVIVNSYYYSVFYVATDGCAGRHASGWTNRLFESTLPFRYRNLA